MGDFRVTVEGIGGHGWDRKAKAGDELVSCSRTDCPDCLTAKYITDMKRITSIHKATFHHWPADMKDHTLNTNNVCTRCGRTGPEACRNYDADREVMDDYSERTIKYPGLTQSRGRRIKGSF
jgi:hypothetical protein